ncbi:glycosyltransferase family A protein [Baekduia soli]|uniref:glycosyltransferase family A protein n=1 Tax=Baekduia soli TaxID=496014 RepID=UPI0016522DD7|nr:glycosyltransferase family A protein [Baekduia soli]
MTSDALTYALVTPARNEADNLPRLGTAIAAQTIPPLSWIIVDDHSDDGSLDWAAAFAAQHAYARALAWDGPAGGALSEGRREARDLHAFRFGITSLPVPADVVVKVDADTSFDPDYFERLLAHFAAEPELGIAGGLCLELEDGRWVARSTVATHPRGASRAYRWACVADVMELEPRMGWDGLDEVKVSLRGFRTRQLPDIAFRHHRAEGGRERHRLRARALSGRASWFMGYRPSYLVLRALHRARRDPAALAMVWGYFAEAVRGTPRCADAAVVAAVRERQALQTLLREGLPART